MSHTPTPWPGWPCGGWVIYEGNKREDRKMEKPWTSAGDEIARLRKLNDELVRDQLAKAAVIFRLHKQRDELVTALREIEANPQHARIIAVDALAKVKP